MFITNWNLWQQNVLQLPCAHPSCKQYFKTPAGHTKHVHVTHPVIAPPALLLVENEQPQTFWSTSHLASPQHEQDPPAEEWDAEFPHPDNANEQLDKSEYHAPDSAFFGLSNKVYCNYHPQLNGILFSQVIQSGNAEK
ncbi:hypothetical protein M404DRAFT_11226 [Pisolithus tinctorius Marx 270]|uniref:C2H2-type domain-containing protein n=1 Tax=Pisolithus tinctorius Marx 270 TaxID=870435 RepID=A0A0C3N124_PISTI|nr:hypothetical protein M404DRAFT_11226 [Pisolithus tinctorius Marx 270]